MWIVASLEIIIICVHCFRPKTTPNYTQLWCNNFLYFTHDFLFRKRNNFVCLRIQLIWNILSILYQTIDRVLRWVWSVWFGSFTFCNDTAGSGYFKHTKDEWNSSATPPLLSFTDSSQCWTQPVLQFFSLTFEMSTNWSECCYQNCVMNVLK